MEPMNGLIALTVIMVVYAVGDMIGTKTKAIISMLFVASVVFAVAFWLGLPKTIFTDSHIHGADRCSYPRWGSCSIPDNVRCS